MKKILALALGVSLLSIITVKADDAKPEKKPAMTEEQKKAVKELKEKYDTNKDGKLDKEERAKMTPEDKAKMKANAPAGGEHHKKKDEAK